MCVQCVCGVPVLHFRLFPNKNLIFKAKVYVIMSTAIPSSSMLVSADASVGGRRL